MNTARWIEGDLEILRKCDAVVVCPGWETSAGTLEEIGFAKGAGIPVYYYPFTPAKKKR